MRLAILGSGAVGGYLGARLGVPVPIVSALHARLTPWPAGDPWQLDRRT